MGVSFAIPIEMAMDVVKQLKDKGRHRGAGWEWKFSRSAAIWLQLRLRAAAGCAAARVMEVAQLLMPVCRKKTLLSSSMARISSGLANCPNMWVVHRWASLAFDCGSWR